MLVNQSVVERIEDGDKEKKRRRRPRRPKHNACFPACGSNNDIRMEGSECLQNASRSNFMTSSVGYSQGGVGSNVPSEHGLAKASNIGFNSMPTMHINEQVKPTEVGNMQNQHLFPSRFVESVFSKSCPVPISSQDPVALNKEHLPFHSTVLNKDYLPSQQTEGYAQRKYFAQHWSVEAVNEALEKGDVFKALFRVNAHNRLEGYCKIDGVPTDILISGFAAQNRAVEGDTVAIKIDPLPLWPRMKGSAGNNTALVEDCNLLLEVTEMVGDSHKGKNKLDPSQESYYGDFYLNGERPTGYTRVNGHYPSSTNNTHAGCSRGQNDVINAVGNICAMVSSYPSKRPTGRVVAIIERTPCRNSVVGFLAVKQWISYKESCRNGTKKNKNSFSIFDNEYIQLTPSNPKYPKMMVPMGDLPDSIKKRLKDGDSTVGMDLVAAQIIDWEEGCAVPRARVMNIFGRGGEIEPRIASILFENAICSSEFSPESLSCLPSIPWDIPLEEVRSRQDLRNLCIITIDPSTAIEADDALSVESLSDGNFRVGVHIADVSYFVRPDTALDIEAQIRSTSVYILKHKLSMLPSLLSENLGSVKPGEDRLAFSVFWDINPAGEVVDRWVGRSVIRSCCKLSYEHAQDIIDGPINADSSTTLGVGIPQVHGNFIEADVIRSVKTLHAVSKTLMEKRFNKGALQLENSKVVFLFDDDGVPFDSILSERTESNFLVEEFMLLANTTVAEVISRAYPDSALLRRHPEPNLRKLGEFEEFCNKHGLELNTSSSGQLHHSLQQIREKLKNDPVLFDILISHASKPMQLATYICSGELKDSESYWSHFALAVPFYTHFTSPLRRYPDIVVHRTLAAVLEAEEMYLNHPRTLEKASEGKGMQRCFTGIYFDKEAAESMEGREALSAAALKHRVPHTEILTDVAAYCNERKIASRHAEDACSRLYMWVLLKNKEILLSEARVLGLGPRFMSIYIQKLAIERRIYYDEVEGLTVDWLEATSTLVLNFSTGDKRANRRYSPGNKYKSLEEAALVVRPCDIIESDSELEPAVFPLTMRLLSTIPVALHAVGGDDGPCDVGARLYMSSYFW